MSYHIRGYPLADISVLGSEDDYGAAESDTNSRSHTPIPPVSPEEIERTLDKLAKQIEEIATQGQAALDTDPLVPTPAQVSPASARRDAANWPKMMNVGSSLPSPPASEHGARSESGRTIGTAAIYSSTCADVQNLHRRSVIEVPEWVAMLALLAVQRNHLSEVCRQLEAVGCGFRPAEEDLSAYMEIGAYLKDNYGPIEIQLYSTRLSHLSERVGERTRSVGKDARPVHPAMDVLYFHSHLASVAATDIEVVSLKILASSGQLSSNAVVEIGRGTPGDDIPELGITWPRVRKLVDNITSGVDQAAYSNRVSKGKRPSSRSPKSRSRGQQAGSFRSRVADLISPPAKK